MGGGGLEVGEGQSSNGAVSGSNVADGQSPVGAGTLQQRAQPRFKKVRRGSGGNCLNNVERRGVLGRGGQQVADEGGGGGGRGGSRGGRSSTGAAGDAGYERKREWPCGRASVAAQDFGGCGFRADKRVKRCAGA